MPLKLLKTNMDKEQTIERVLHAKRYALTLDKELCTGCGICAAICPREAIEIKKSPKVEGERVEPPTINIDEQKCHYCGMCGPICPFGAIEVKVDGEHLISVLESESFPQFIREIDVDTTKCDLDCVDCEEACPLELIKVRVTSPDGEEVRDIKSWPGKENLKVVVDIDKNLCPCCRLCELKCPDDAIRVRKMIQGFIKITPERCPENCQDCLDVCPITGALYLSEDEKVHVNELFCIYCGACKMVCPEEDALELQRTSIRHTPIRSGAWNKALEKLTSTKEMTKELQAKSVKKVKETVEKRLAWRG
ncbi:MAG: 4Fe-4S dicluster domain-containing protein [Candidatus Bathyarchaeota archaeon]|nr:MAG: 4Fe-4S dicluster domain-containing protein [Candidatus Bathyarchaeota archaeon]